MGLYDIIDALSCYVHMSFPTTARRQLFALCLMMHITKVVIAAPFVVSCVYTEVTHNRTMTSVL